MTRKTLIHRIALTGLRGVLAPDGQRKLASAYLDASQRADKAERELGEACAELASRSSADKAEGYALAQEDARRERARTDDPEPPLGSPDTDPAIEEDPEIEREERARMAERDAAERDAKWFRPRYGSPDYSRPYRGERKAKGSGSPDGADPALTWEEVVTAVDAGARARLESAGLYTDPVREALKLIKWSVNGRLRTTAGKAFSRGKRRGDGIPCIELAGWLVDVADSADPVAAGLFRADTVAHELAHVLANRYAGRNTGHGPTWLRFARALGASGERCYPEEERAQAYGVVTRNRRPRVAIRCTHCGATGTLADTTWARWRRQSLTGRPICGSCRTGEYLVDEGGASR